MNIALIAVGLAISLGVAWGVTSVVRKIIGTPWIAVSVIIFQAAAIVGLLLGRVERGAVSVNAREVEVVEERADEQREGASCALAMFGLTRDEPVIRR